jgi:hypothetical protein
MNPSTVGSMTIVVPSLERVVVIFSTTLDGAVVTVGNVLIAVYRVAQESAFERHGEFGAKHAIEGRRNLPASGQADSTVNAYTPAFEKLGKDYWWAGVYPCHNDRDIWVLRTRRINYR